MTDRRIMRRLLLTTSAAVIAAGIVAVPVTVERDGSFASAAAWAKKDGGNSGGNGNGNGGGSGSSGGSGNSGGSGSSGGSSNGSSSSSGSSTNGSGKTKDSDASAPGQSSTDSTAAKSTAGIGAAMAQAEQDLKTAQDKLAAAAKALAETVVDGDATKIAVARGRVAGAQYAVSAAEMDLAVAAVGAVEPAAEGN